MSILLIITAIIFIINFIRRWFYWWDVNMIKRFDKIEGKCIERIDGQNHYVYSKFDFMDMA